MSDLPDVTKAVDPSFLVQRLGQRGIKPVGVVDVRPFQAQYRRIPSWLVQRSVLLNQLQRRYSSQDTTASADSELVLAVPGYRVSREPTSEEVEAGRRGQDSNWTSDTRLSFLTSPASEGIESSSRAFRISRTVAPFLHRDAAKIEIAPTPILQSEADRSRQIDTIARSPEVSIPSPPSSSTETLPLQTKRHSSSSAEPLIPVESFQQSQTQSITPEGGVSLPNSNYLQQIDETARSPEASMPPPLSTPAKTLPLQTKPSPSSPVTLSPLNGHESSLQPLAPSITPRDVSSLVDSSYSQQTEAMTRSPELSIATSLPLAADVLPLQTKLYRHPLGTEPIQHNSGISVSPSSVGQQMASNLPNQNSSSTQGRDGTISSSRDRSISRSITPSGGNMIRAVAAIPLSGGSDKSSMILRQRSPALPRSEELAVSSSIEVKTAPFPLLSSSVVSQPQPLQTAITEGQPSSIKSVPPSDRPSESATLAPASRQKRDRLATVLQLSGTPNPLLQTQMIWRKSAGGSSPQNSFTTMNRNQKPFPLASGSQAGDSFWIARQADSNAGSMIATTESLGDTSSAPVIASSVHPQPQRINVAQIAEQVSRILARRLTVECERRGINQW